VTIVGWVPAALDSRGCKPRKSGKSWAARCPLHHDPRQRAREVR